MRGIKCALNIPDFIVRICERFHREGVKCYVVGGAVRDLMAGLEAKDFDIASSLAPSEVKKIFKRVVETGVKYGTVTILYEGHKVEHTTFRKESSYSDSRHPDSVDFTEDLAEDLKRRDFTVNAMAYDPLDELLFDPWEGRRDIERKLLRTVGDPKERFSEDALRVVRAARFCAQLEFVPSPEMESVLPDFKDSIALLSRERIRDELIKMLICKKPSIGLDMLHRAGILAVILPELAACDGVEQGGPHHFDVYRHSLLACDRCNGGPLLRLAALLHDIGKAVTKAPRPDGKGFCFYTHERVGAEMAARRMRKLRFSNREIEYVSVLIREHMFQYTEDWSDGAVRRLILRAGEENIFDLIELRKADIAALAPEPREDPVISRFADRVARLLEKEHAFKITDLAVDGHDIMRELNLSPGREVGKILRLLHSEILENPELNTREYLIHRIRRMKTESNP